ncbi:hypothetical protein ACLOJK_007281 [Asimina triloba]
MIASPYKTSAKTDKESRAPKMSSSCRLLLSLPLPSLGFPHRPSSSLAVDSKWIQPPKCHGKIKASMKVMIERLPRKSLEKPISALQLGALLASVELPAFAVTGENNEEDFTWVLIQLGIVAVWYLLLMPPIILNWIRLRFYKRKLLEMYLQFMFVFIFFPGLLIWAPFLNFRRLPRDPNMKYPWSNPDQDPSLKDPNAL